MKTTKNNSGFRIHDLRFKILNRKSLILICIFANCLLPAISSAQSFTTLWSQTNNPSNSSDYPYSITADAGGIYVAGVDNVQGNDKWRMEKYDLCGTSALNITATFANPLCNNQCNGTAAVSASGGSPSYTYAWSPGGETTSSVTGLCAGIYTVTVTDAVPAAVTATVNITQPTALLSSVASANVSCNSLCNGTSSVTISGGTPNYTYSWNTTPVQTSANAAGLCAGNYTVTITDANGCTQTQTVTITQPAALTAAAASTATACGNNNGSAAANAGGGTSPYTYSWLPAGGTNAAATGLASGTYTIIITDTKGCTETQTVTVAPSLPGELYLPNAFSPNGDNENDVLKIYIGNINCIKAFQLVIYNRWGEKMFESTNPIAQWDGVYTDRMMHTQVFVYYLEATLTDGEQITKKGNISLIR